MKKVNLNINGCAVQVIADAKLVLLDLLRDILNLTGTKQSCDRKGQCGACTVIVNGKTVLSCLTKVAGLNGAEVITIEGLGTPDNPHLIQEAFVLAALGRPHAHAKILPIDVSAALQQPGVVGVMTADDIKGSNRLKYMIPDRPILCKDRVCYIGDPVTPAACG